MVIFLKSECKMFKEKSFLGIKILVLFLAMILWIQMTPVNVSAEDYRFSIPENFVIYAIDSDGKASVSYEFTIENQEEALIILTLRCRTISSI